MIEFVTNTLFLFQQKSTFSFFSPGHITNERVSWAGSTWTFTLHSGIRVKPETRRTMVFNCLDKDPKTMLEHGHVYKTTGAHYKDGLSPQRCNLPQKNILAVVLFTGSNERDHHDHVGRHQHPPPKQAAL